nr:reverse transcriptase domain-containing protein [Tanacetum cinerariifolium]
MPPGIENDDYDSKGDILSFEEFFSNNSHSLPKNESFHFDIPSSSRPPAKPPNDDEIKPNSGTLTVKVVGDIFEHYVPMPRLFPTQPTLASNQEKSPHLLSYRSLKAFSAFFYKSDDDLWREHSYLGCSIYPFLPSLTSSNNFPARMVALIKRKKQVLTKKLAIERKDRPMTQGQQRTYMRQFVKNRSCAVYFTGWSMAYVKSFTDDQLKPEFEKIQKSTEAPIPSVPKVPQSPVVSSPKSSSKKRKSLGRMRLTKPKSKLQELDLDADDQTFIKVVSNEDSEDEAPRLWSALILHMVDRHDLVTLYGLVVKYYENHPVVGDGLILWGDLQVLLDSYKGGKGSFVWNHKYLWHIRSWRLYTLSNVYVLETISGEVVYMFADVPYPLSVKLMERMLTHKLEIDKDVVGNDMTTAEQLIRVFNSPMLHFLRVKMVINSPWIMPILGTKEMASPEQTALDNFPARMAALIKRKKQVLAKKLAIERKDRPMTQGQQRTYMRQFVKNQSCAVYFTGWSMAYVKSFTDDQLKAEFEKIQKVLSNIQIQAFSRTLKRTGAVIENLPPRDINAIYRIDWSTAHFTTLRLILHMVDRHDLVTLYGLVVKYYENHPVVGDGLILWGDLQVLLDSHKGGKGSFVWNHKYLWQIRSWRLYTLSNVYVLETISGEVVYMFADVPYPLSVKLMERMLTHKLEIDKDVVGNDMTTAEQLIRVFNSHMLHFLRVKMVINSPWIMPILGTKEMASPEQTALDAAFSRDIPLICSDFSSILVKTQSSRYVVPTGRVVVPTGRHSKQIVEPKLRTIVETPVATMADTRTMSELLQAPAEGYGDAIVLPLILAENFELKTINLKNDIANFQQRFDESFGEAWDHFEDLLRKCPHHSFSKLHQIDTFYNALTQSDQDSLNAAAGGNLLNRTPRDALTIIENRSKVRISRNKTIVSKVNSTTSSPFPSLDVTALAEIVKELVLMNKATQQATVKSVEETCVTCGEPHPYYECLATGCNTFDACAAVGTYNQGGNGYRPQGDPNYHARNQMG